jgi:hypothetical protein
MFFTQLVFLYADIPLDEFLVIDNNQQAVALGNKLSTIFDVYKDISFKGESVFSNIIYREYERVGIIYSISKYEDVEINARIRRIQLFSDYYHTKRGISIGSSQEDLIKIYGVPDFVRNKTTYVYQNTWGDHMELIFRLNGNMIVDYIELVGGN